MPSSTQLYYSTTVQENTSAASYSLQVATNFGWWRHRSLLFLILLFLILTSFSCISYTEFLIFRWRPSLNLSPAFFLIAGLNCSGGTYTLRTRTRAGSRKMRAGHKTGTWYTLTFSTQCIHIIAWTRGTHRWKDFRRASCSSWDMGIIRIT